MNELEVRFALNDEEDYNKAISYLEKQYKFKCENKQVDEYFKAKGREFENDEVGSFIYRIRQEDDNTSCIFTRKDTIKQGMWNESEIELESEKLDFVRKMMQTGFSNVFTISKYRKTFHNALENKTINLDKIDGLGFYLEIEILGDFSQEDYNHFYDKMCGEFSFLNSKIETKGYVQLMREKSGRN